MRRILILLAILVVPVAVFAAMVLADRLLGLAQPQQRFAIELADRIERAELCLKPLHTAAHRAPIFVQRRQAHLQVSNRKIVRRGFGSAIDQRLHVLAMLLEGVGLKKALSLCPPEAVRAALDEANLKSEI